jgi:signal transduction histidine kinase
MRPARLAGYVRTVRMRTTWARARQRLQRVPGWMIDAAVGTVIVLGGVLTTGGDDVTIYKDRDALAWALILAGTVPYYFRRRAPFTVFVVTAAAISTLMLLEYDPGALPFALLVGAYAVGAYRPGRVVLAAFAVIGALLLMLYVGGAPEFGAGELLSSLPAFGAAMLLGWSMQTRGRHIDALEHGQEEAALRAAADERLRIAQELHDIVAHSLGVIAVQAGVGMHVVETDAAEARRALENISRTSRSSLAEIRRLLGVLRNADGTPAYTPAPGLADLPRLTREVADAGLPVDVSVDGDLDRVPPGVGLAAYRIVQEALTNTLRHARANRARVHLDSTSGALLIEVTDDGHGANGAPVGGHGLVGMRERVAVYGGSLDAGPARGGGFRVAARLPYDAEPAL